MRRLTMILATFLLSVSTGPAEAAEVDRTVEPGAIVVRDQKPGDRRSGSRPAGDSRRWHSYRSVRWITNRGFCLDTLWTTDENFARRQNNMARAIRFAEANGGMKQDCPPDAVPVPDVGTIAEQRWEALRNLPVPTLRMQPNYAITGMRVYLEIGGHGSTVIAVENPVGDDITITATSDYVVDWGDPGWSARTVTRSQGGPWPDGDVTHVYTDVADAAMIKVTQRWRATWSAGGRSGVLEQRTTESAPLTFEVRQLQAVRNR